jgi:hypothetical protein
MEKEKPNPYLKRKTKTHMHKIKKLNPYLKKKTKAHMYKINPP